MNRSALGLACAVAAAAALLGWRLWSSGPPPAPALPPATPLDPAPLAASAAALAAERAALAPTVRQALEAAVESLGGLGADGLDAERAALATIAGTPGAASVLVAALEPAPGPRATPGAPETTLRRAAIARALGATGDRRALPALAARVTDPDEPGLVVEAAAAAIGALGDRAGLPAVLALLWEVRPPDHGVRVACGAAALRLGAPDGGDALVDVCMDWGADPAARPRVYDRERAMRALAATAGREVAPIERFLLPRDLRAAGEGWQAWWVAARGALVPDAAITTDRALLGAFVGPHVAALRGESYYLARLAHHVLAGLGADGRPYLLHALRHEAPAVRRNAAEALALARDPASLPHLWHCWASDPATVVRQAVLGAIMAIGGDDATRVLEEALRDPDGEIRARAAALGTGLRK